MNHKISDNGVSRDMTDIEQAAHDTWAAQIAADLAIVEQLKTDAAAARASGLAKLKALGLTDAEIAALVG